MACVGGVMAQLPHHPEEARPPGEEPPSTEEEAGLEQEL